MQPAIESVYSYVGSICSICLILLIAKLNDLEIYQADVAYAYLEAYSKEQIFFISGKDFTTSGMEGHIYLEHYTNAGTEWSCDWLRLFGGHRFDLLSTGRAKCAWVPCELHNAQKKAIVKKPTL